MFCRFCGSPGKEEFKECSNPDCKGRRQNENRYCETCGRQMKSSQFVRTMSNGKKHIMSSFPFICPHCPPPQPDIAHTLSNWANSLCRLYPERVVIIGECKCLTPKKIKHHPCYKTPFTIELLCRHCHVAEHSRLKKLAAQAAIDSTTPPPDRAYGDDNRSRGDNNTDRLGCSTITRATRLNRKDSAISRDSNGSICQPSPF